MNSSLIFSPRGSWAYQTLEVHVNSVDGQYVAEIKAFFQEAVTGDVSEDDISELIRRAYFKWPTYIIRAEDAPENPDKLNIYVELKQVVSEIKIEGYEEVEKKDLLSRISLKPGDRFSPEQLVSLEGFLKDYYFYRGFPEADVAVKSHKTPEGFVVVHIQVAEGRECHLEEVVVDVEGSQGPPPRVGFDLSRGDRCDVPQVLRASETLKERLRRDGYLAHRLSEPELNYTEDRAKANLRISLALGPQIEISFRGNTFAFERDAIMKKAVDYAGETEFNTTWIESKAKEGIKGFYRELGYPKAEVIVEDRHDASSQSREIVFKISRGPKIRIRSVQFEGNDGLPSQRLEKEFWASAEPKTRKRIFVEKEVEDASDALLDFYQSLGYLQAQIDEPQVSITPDGYAQIAFKIEEGGKSVLEDFRISGNTVFSNHEIKGMMKSAPGDAINPVFLKENAAALTERYHRLGYKFAKVTLPKLEDIDAGRVLYPIQIEEGPKIILGGVSVRGNFRTKERVITRELSFENGETYDPQKIRESRRKLLQLGFFDGVSIEELPYDPKTLREDIVIRVSERKPRSIIFRPGYSTDDGVRGTLEFRYSNLFGTGRNFNSFLRVNRRFSTDGNILERRVVLTYQEPYLIDKIHGKVSFIQERRDEQQFDIDRTSFIVGLERNFFTWIRTSASWELEFRNPFNELPGAILSPIDESEARFGSIKTFIDIDRRDDLLNASKGTLHRVEFDFYNQGLLSDADFYQVFLRNNFYYPIYKRLRSILSLRMGFSGTFGDTQRSGVAEIPIEKRFRLGGNNSFRGVGLNCIGGLPGNAPENCGDALLSQAPGGNALFNYMFEVLVPLFKDFDFAIFTDGGNAYLQNGDYDIFNIRNSVGFGFRYNTFFGPMRFDYGILLDRRTGEGFGTFHFAVGQF